MMQFQSLARYTENILDQNARAFTHVVQMIQAQQAQAFESLKKTFPQTPKPDVVLYDILANRVRSQDYQSVGQLAGQYRNRMENIGKLRPGSSSATAKRRMQEILNEHVYGVRVHRPKRLNTDANLAIIRSLFNQPRLWSRTPTAS